MDTMYTAVAGAGAVDKDTVYELLDDWAGIDSEGRLTGDKQVHLLIPASAEHVTPAVKALYNWSGNANPEIPYTAVVAQTLDKASKVIRDNAEDAVAARDEEIYTILGRTLAERDGDRYLLVAAGEDDGELRDLVEYAIGEDITVLDLRDALKQITPLEPAPEVAAHENNGETEDDGCAEPAAITPDEEPCRGGAQTLVSLPAQTPAPGPEENAATEHHRITAADPEGLQGVIAVLEDVTYHLRLVDDSNAAANLAAPRYRPITQRALDGLAWAKSLQSAGGQPRTTAADPEEAQPAKRSAGKVRKEWFNPKTDTWEPLRGRPRKDVEIREVAA